jgi:hypothetical protein
MHPIDVAPEFFGCGIPSRSEANSNDSISRDDAFRIFDILRPKPIPFPLIRIGDGSDGSYLVPDDLNGISGCLSPGVNNFKHFEDELATRYGISSDMFDGSSDAECLATPLIQGQQTFTKTWLDSDEKPNSISICTWLKSKPVEEKDFILQMDIEGAEYRNILNTSRDDLSRFRIIILELHRLAAGFSRPRVFHHVLKPFLEKLSSDFVCVHAHPNNVTYTYSPPSLGVLIPSILEVTLLRKDRIPYNAQRHPLPVSLPHRLDITNVPGRIPLVLSREWLQGTRPMDSRVKILEDWLALYRYHQPHGTAAPLIVAQLKSAVRRFLSHKSVMK